MKIYCHPRWSTCKKTIRLIEELGVSYELFDLTKESVELETLVNIYNREGLPLKKFFNTSGVEYRKNNVKELFDKLSEEEMLKLISENGLLLKRPFIIDEKVYIGNKLEEIESDYRK